MLSGMRDKTGREGYGVKKKLVSTAPIFSVLLLI
jgi:hypothetical protein